MPSVDHFFVNVFADFTDNNFTIAGGSSFECEVEVFVHEFVLEAETLLVGVIGGQVVAAHAGHRILGVQTPGAAGAHTHHLSQLLDVHPKVLAEGQCFTCAHHFNTQQQIVADFGYQARPVSAHVEGLSPHRVHLGQTPGLNRFVRATQHETQGPVAGCDHSATDWCIDLMEFVSLQ